MDTVRYFKEVSKTRLKALHAAGDIESGLQQVQHQVAVDAGYRSWGALLDAGGPDQSLALVMDREPQLNKNGFGAGTYARTLKERREQFAQWRTELRGGAEHVDELRKWLLQNIEPRQTINTEAHSYHLKHLAEEDLGGYVANGELIAAAIIAGYPYRRGSGDSPNASFGMSMRSLTALRRRVRPQRR
jgi:hypothetical protein